MAVCERRLVARLRDALSDLGGAKPLLVAVSGGADSTALAHLVARAWPGSVPARTLLHLDHGLRSDSGEDARFVIALGERLGCPVQIERADVGALASERGLGIEEAGRHARFAFFARAAERHGDAAVLLAHTLDDQAETFLLRLARGAGAAGLAAMRPVREGRYRRPLLGTRREELRELLAAIGAGWREDPTGTDLRFARNRVRHQVLPALAAVNLRAAEHIARATTRLAEDEALLGELALGALDTGSATLDARALASLPPALGRRAALTWLRARTGDSPELGHEHVDTLLALARSELGAHATDLPGGRRVLRSGERLAIVDPPPRLESKEITT